MLYDRYTGVNVVGWLLLNLFIVTTILPRYQCTGNSSGSSSKVDMSSYVSVRELDKYGNAVQVSHALEAAKRYGRPVIVAVVVAESNPSKNKDKQTSSPSTSGDVTNDNVTSPEAFLVAVSLGSSPILYPLQISSLQSQVKTAASKHTSIPSSSSYLAMCCTGVKGDAMWLIRQLQIFSSQVWERYDSQLSSPAVAHTVARLLGRYAGLPEKREWSTVLRLPGSNEEEGEEEENSTPQSSSKWARPLGIQTLIVSAQTKTSNSPALLQVDPSGRILKANYKSSSGKVSVATIGRECDQIQPRLQQLFETNTKSNKKSTSWEDVPPSLEDCQEALVRILLDETKGSRYKRDDIVQVEVFSSATGKLEKKTMTR